MESAKECFKATQPAHTDLSKALAIESYDT